MLPSLQLKGPLSGRQHVTLSSKRTGLTRPHKHLPHAPRPLRRGADKSPALQRGSALLPDLHVTDSSEAMLSGRKPPFRLLVRAMATDGRSIRIRHAVSEGFVVRLPCCACSARA